MESNIINVASSGCTQPPAHQPYLQIQSILDYQVLRTSTKKDIVLFKKLHCAAYPYQFVYIIH